MSAVAPSPPMPTKLIFLAGSFPLRIMAFMPASHPEITAAGFSKALWIHGTRHEVSGRGDEMISMHLSLIHISEPTRPY